MHRLSVVCNDEMAQVERQKWVNALQEHAAYSSHYLYGDQRRADSDDDNGIQKEKHMQSTNYMLISLTTIILSYLSSDKSKTIRLYVRCTCIGFSQL